MSRERFFVHPDGRTYGVQVLDFRVREHWTLPGKRGGSNLSTREDAADAEAHAAAKAKELTKKGFVEEASRPGIEIDPTVDVIDALHSDLDYAGKRREDFQPTDTAHSWTTENVVLRQWLVTSDDRRLAILLRSRSGSPREMGEAIAREMLRLRDAILEDRETPARKFPLSAPIGRFTHLVVLSPAVTNRTISRDVNIQSFVLARSIFDVFPAFDCEMSGDETPGMADARTTGHGSIPLIDWNRAPHPVFDLAYPKSRGEPKYLVYAPKELERRLGAAALAKMKEPVVLARNYRGEVRRFAKGDTPDMASLRAFFGFDP